MNIHNTYQGGGDGRMQMLTSIVEQWLLSLAKWTFELGSKTQNESSKLKFGMNQQPIQTTSVFIMTFVIYGDAPKQRTIPKVDIVEGSLFQCKYSHVPCIDLLRHMSRWKYM